MDKKNVLVLSVQPRDHQVYFVPVPIEVCLSDQRIGGYLPIGKIAITSKSLAFLTR